MNEYDVLKMDDEEYLEYCKEMCKREKIWICLSLFVVAVFLFLLMYGLNNELGNTNVFFAFFLGVFSVFASNFGEEYRRWKLVINRFKKERTNYDSDDN